MGYSSIPNRKVAVPEVPSSPQFCLCSFSSRTRMAEELYNGMEFDWKRPICTALCVDRKGFARSGLFCLSSAILPNILLLYQCLQQNAYMYSIVSSP